jgi:hypothetical protein
MSKIPQGEWNAIAARYQNGESISKIARSYDCTPPAIHYILKRNHQRPADFAVQPLPRPAPATESQLVKLNPPEPAPVSGETFASPAPGPSLVRADAPGATPNLPGGMPGAVPSAVPGGAVPDERAATQPAAVESCRAAVTPPSEPAPVLPGLDSQLHLRAEAAIAMFRSSFDAALAEGSQPVREQLRQAAADLMKVAARTTIVLDRLNANAERSGRAHNYPRSAHAGEDFGKFG